MSDLPSGVTLLKSGRFHARLMFRGTSYRSTWDTARQAEAWIRRTRSELAAGTYAGQELIDPDSGKPLPPTLAEYKAEWLASRDLKPSTRSEYARMLPHTKPLDRHRLDQITPEMVDRWYDGLRSSPRPSKGNPHPKSTPMPATHRAHVYSLLRSVMSTAVKRRIIATNPCQVDGGGKTPKRAMPDLPTPAEVHKLADAMGVGKYRTMTLVAAWCGLRFGEITELRRKDVALNGEGTPIRVRVRRAVTHVDGTPVVGLPKSEAGVRDVGIPPHIRPDVADYLDTLPERPDGLLFPGTRSGEHMKPSSLYKVWYRARDEAGFPALRWHDLRHFSGTLAAQTGATLAELKARLGHSTVQAAMTYQHAVSGRDDLIAEAMSNNVIPLLPRSGTSAPGGKVDAASTTGT